MNFKAISIFIGYLLMVEGLTMLPAAAIAGYHGESSAVTAFAITILLLALIGFPLMRRKKSGGVYAKEGFVTVALGWILLSFFGCLPFYISGAIPKLIDAWFETVSGFTTTGATILADVEALPRSMLYWRSFTHWLGGMGVLVLILAIASFSKGSGETLHLLRAESPGPVVGKLTPTMKQSARILYSIYILLTALETLLLCLGGMPLFDSVAHAFGTVGTGGFSVKNGSIGAYNSAYIETVIAIFMLLSGTNFTIFYLIYSRQFRTAFKNEELRLYAILVAAGTALLAISIRPLYATAEGALRHGFFQVASIITTTGYATADYNLWPEVARFALVILMLTGACAGSTTGGIKLSRIIILWRSLRSQMQLMLRPRSVRHVRVEGKTLNEDVVKGAHAYIIAYVFIGVASVLLVSIDGHSMETYVTAVLTCLSNTGPGLDMVGPTGNFGFFSTFSKLVFSVDMLVGRLEIFPMLLLFMPSTWKRQA